MYISAGMDGRQAGECAEYLVHQFDRIIRLAGDVAGDCINGVPEGLALSEMIKYNMGGPVLREEAQIQCTRYKTTLDAVISRYPGIIREFVQIVSSEEEGDYQEAVNIVEFGVCEKGAI